ncbi:MAG: hypothetical protein ACRC1E_11665 [Craterilacuibacter sp.]
MLILHSFNQLPECNSLLAVFQRTCTCNMPFCLFVVAQVVGVVEIHLQMAVFVARRSNLLTRANALPNIALLQRNISLALVFSWC